MSEWYPGHKVMFSTGSHGKNRKGIPYGGKIWVDIDAARKYIKEFNMEFCLAADTDINRSTA